MSQSTESSRPQWVTLLQPGDVLELFLCLDPLERKPIYDYMEVWGTSRDCSMIYGSSRQGTRRLVSELDQRLSVIKRRGQIIYSREKEGDQHDIARSIEEK